MKATRRRKPKKPSVIHGGAVHPEADKRTGGLLIEPSSQEPATGTGDLVPLPATMRGVVRGQGLVHWPEPEGPEPSRAELLALLRQRWPRAVRAAIIRALDTSPLDAVRRDQKAQTELQALKRLQRADELRVAGERAFIKKTADDDKVQPGTLRQHRRRYKK